MVDKEDLGVKIENGSAYLNGDLCVRAFDFNRAALRLASGEFPGGFGYCGVLTDDGAALVEAAANAGVKWNVKSRRFMDADAVPSYPKWGSAAYKSF